MKLSKLNRSAIFAGIFAMSASLSLQSHAHPSQLTLISGRPDYNLPWTRSMVRDGFSFIPNPEIDFSTQQLSILARSGVRQVSIAEIINQYGQTTFQLIERALQFAASRSPVASFVVNTDPRGNNYICDMMANYPNTAFVVAPTVQPGNIHLEDEPACGAHNILRVTELNQTLNDLGDYAPRGDTVRVAAPSIDIPTTGWGGRPTAISGSLPATASVAAALALFASEHHAELSGEALIEQFLAERTVVVPSLEGKVENARAFIPRH
jgi:subtilisin family serine protease